MKQDIDFAVTLLTREEANLIAQQILTDEEWKAIKQELILNDELWMTLNPEIAKIILKYVDSEDLKPA